MTGREGTAVLPHILKIIETALQIGETFGKVGELAGKAMDFVKNHLNDIMGIGNKLMTGIQALFGLIAAHPVIAIVTGIIAVITLLWTHCEAFRNFWIGLWEKAKESASVAAEAISGFLSNAWSVIQSAWQSAGEFFANIWQSIQDAFSSAADVLGGFFSSAWSVASGAWSAATSFFSGISSGIQSAFSATTNFLGSAFQSAYQAAQSAWSGATSFFSGTWSGIVGIFGDAFSAFSNIGGNMLEGIWSGISDKIAWLKSKVTGVIDTIKGWFTGSSGFDTHSPSKWSKGVFLNVMEGGGIGFEAGKPSLMKEVEDVVASVKSGLDFGVTNIGVTATGTYSTTGTAQNGAQAGFGGVGNTTVVNIYNPEKRDAVTEAREWKKTTQRMAMSYV